jgi:hypothetical protein
MSLAVDELSVTSCRVFTCRRVVGDDELAVDQLSVDGLSPHRLLDENKLLRNQISSCQEVFYYLSNFIIFGCLFCFPLVFLTGLVSGQGRISLSACPLACLLIHQSGFPSVCLSVCLPVCVPDCLSVCFYVCLTACLHV